MDGIDALSHAELLSILLGSGVKGHPVKAISEDLILHHGSLNQMACADIPQLCQTRGIGVDKAMIIKAAFGDLDYSSDGMVDITLSVSYDFAKLAT